MDPLHVVKGRFPWLLLYREMDTPGCCAGTSTLRQLGWIKPFEWDKPPTGAGVCVLEGLPIPPAEKGEL